MKLRKFFRTALFALVPIIIFFSSERSEALFWTLFTFEDDPVPEIIDVLEPLIAEVHESEIAGERKFLVHPAAPMKGIPLEKHTIFVLTRAAAGTAENEPCRLRILDFSGESFWHVVGDFGTTGTIVRTDSMTHDESGGNWAVCAEVKGGAQLLVWKNGRYEVGSVENGISCSAEKPRRVKQFCE